jgi:hypothetical protein
LVFPTAGFTVLILSELTRITGESFTEEQISAARLWFLLRCIGAALEPSLTGPVVRLDSDVHTLAQQFQARLL